MFRIFHRRDEHKRDEKTTSSTSVSQQHKRHHARRRRHSRVTRDIRSRQGLPPTKRHWSTADIDRYQVMIKNFYNHL